MIIKKGKWWLVISHTGRILGRHSTRAEAEAQHYAIVKSRGGTAHPQQSTAAYRRAVSKVRHMSMREVLRRTPRR